MMAVGELKGWAVAAAIAVVFAAVLLAMSVHG
jgi:hypothetical protein